MDSPSFGKSYRVHRVYCLDNPKKAGQVVAEIKKSVDNLQLFPNIGVSTTFPNTRELAHPTYNFLIRYRINKKSVEVLFVGHSAQNHKTQ
jgi:plasmid stabilization system protein ParE